MAGVAAGYIRRTTTAGPTLSAAMIRDFAARHYPDVFDQVMARVDESGTASRAR
jgi:hypothetical protein